MTGEHRVVTTPAWIGYDEPYEPDEPYPVPRRALTSADLERLEVEVCAPSLTAFLARIESAKRFILVEQMALSQEDQGAKMNLRLSAIFKDGDTRATQ